MDKLKYKVLILGLGNSIMSDDGAGVYAVEMLQRRNWPEGVLILEVGTSVLDYLDEISRSYHVMVIDALKTGEKPGTIHCLGEKKITHFPGNRRDAHGFSIFEVVELARELTGYPRKLTIYGIEPLELGFGGRLSREVKRALPGLVDRIAFGVKSENL